MKILICMFLLVISTSIYADFLAQVVGISDGDTITVLSKQDHQQYKVRLANIDAPESGQPFAQRSKQYLSSLIFQHPVIIQDAGQDKYGRIIGTVLKGNDNINRLMVRHGMAYAYHRYLTDPTIANLETYAKQQRIGIWSSASAQISPEQYRRMNNQR